MSLPKICTCPTVPAADCPFHNQDACGSLASASGSAKITQRQLESILINEGIIQAAAIENPEGYDGGRTELAVTIATQQINDLLSPNAEVRHGAKDADLD